MRPRLLYWWSSQGPLRRVVEITIVGSPPASDALEAIITFAQERSQFVEGVTFEIGQVTGLSAAVMPVDTRAMRQSAISSASFKACWMLCTVASMLTTTPRFKPFALATPRPARRSSPPS